MAQARLSLSRKPHNGLSDKIAAIRRGYEDSLRYQSVRALAEKLSLSPMGRTSYKALYVGLKTAFRYIPDPVGTELIKSPRRLVEEIKALGYASGDCDDAASLAYTMLRSLGIPAVLVVGWYRDDIYPSHIWTRIPLADGRHVEFDLTAPSLDARKSGLREVREYA